MAKILTTAIVADIRNKLNGSVFSKNRYGSYVRTKVTPVNPQTVDQQNARNVLSSLSQAWRGLTQPERDSWISAAPSFPFTDIFGNSKILSGNALFVKLNANLAQAGGGGLASAPTPVAISSLTLGAIVSSAGGGTLTVAFAPTPVNADEAVIIRATPNMGAGIKFVKNRYRFVQVVAAAGASPANIAAAFTAKFGAPVEGQNIFIEAFIVSTLTGQAGIPTSGFVTVAA